MMRPQVQRRNAREPLKEARRFQRRRRRPAGADDSRGLNLETAALDAQHFMDDRLRLRNAAFVRRQSEHDGSPGSEHSGAN